MNNLLRTLTESQVKPSPDLRLLLSAVKDARRQSFDAKVSEPFYDSLEGLLHDLRTVTMDNHDAEAFLKPVAKSDVPDYYDVIVNPMDLQTMLKKVKSKQYKSKREFADDLDLIWSNCFTYNATEVCITVVKTRGEAHCAAQDHPLRQCAMRLKKKADRLLLYPSLHIPLLLSQ
jgi:transcriptional activator SPT7